MQTELGGTLLTRDLVSADGRTIAHAGQIADLAFLSEVVAHAPRGLHERPLHDTFAAEAVLEAFEAPALQFLVGDAEGRAAAADVLSTIKFPEEIWLELELLRRDDPLRYQHAVWTAVVSARLFRSALGEAPGVPRLAAGALVHDIGMRHAAPRLRWKREHLTAAEALALEDHPLLGALVLASVLGDAPAVHFALLHHTRAGFGYPRVAGTLPPMRGLDVVAVASAFAAMVAPRSYRGEPYDPRGAVDQLLEESQAGHFDDRAVRLLILCLRRAKGGLHTLQLPRLATGKRPVLNRHGLAAPQSACAG